MVIKRMTEGSTMGSTTTMVVVVVTPVCPTRHGYDLQPSEVPVLVLVLGGRRDTDADVAADADDVLAVAAVVATVADTHSGKVKPQVQAQQQSCSKVLLRYDRYWGSRGR
jgi:hypothetical protein